MSESYRPQIERALRFIADHLDRPLTVAEVAKVAYLSEFHFHRIFSAVMGEPVGRYITRKRLEIAALRLAYEPASSITRIGHECGYSSTSNFTKALLGAVACPTTANYSGAKAALNAWSHALRGEVESRGVRVAVFMPSHTQTEGGSKAHFDVAALPLGYVVEQPRARPRAAQLRREPGVSSVPLARSVVSRLGERQVARSTRALCT